MDGNAQQNVKIFTSETACNTLNNLLINLTWIAKLNFLFLKISIKNNFDTFRKTLIQIMTYSGTIQESSTEPKSIDTFVEPKWTKGSIWSGLE